MDLYDLVCSRARHEFFPERIGVAMLTESSLKIKAFNICVYIHTHTYTYMPRYCTVFILTGVSSLMEKGVARKI
jgi:hypothetical protein